MSTAPQQIDARDRASVCIDAKEMFYRQRMFYVLFLGSLTRIPEHILKYSFDGIVGLILSPTPFSSLSLLLRRMMRGVAHNKKGP